MTEKLTKKEKGFVKDYIETGNGTQSALKHYDTEDYSTAGAIASENLKKPKIQNAIAEAMPEEMLSEKHLQLLNATNLERLNFNDKDTNETIKEVVSRMPGYELLNIVENTNSDGAVMTKYAYVKAPDNMAQDKALDKAYKIKGLYAPEKSVNLNIEANIADLRSQELAQEYEEKLKQGL